MEKIKSHREYLFFNTENSNNVERRKNFTEASCERFGDRRGYSLYKSITIWSDLMYL